MNDKKPVELSPTVSGTGSNCPKCGSRAVCNQFTGGGGGDYVDDYTFYCPTCLHTESSQRHAGIEMGEVEDTICPYCGKQWYDHPHDRIEDIIKDPKADNAELKMDFNPNNLYQDDRKPSPLVITCADGLKKYFAQYPEQLRQLNSRTFEELVADVLTDFGFETELTSFTEMAAKTFTPTCETL